MSKIKGLIIMGFFASIFGINAQSAHIKVLSVTEFKEQIEANKVVLIDVRTPKEFQQGSIKNSENIDFYDPQFTAHFTEFNKEEPIYLFCHSGGRSNKAARKLEALGFKEIYDLKGGFSSWKSSN